MPTVRVSYPAYANLNPNPNPHPHPNQGFLERTMTKKNRKDFLSTVGP